MASTPYTFDDIALSTRELLHAAAINTMLEDSDFLRMSPQLYWGAGRYVQYVHTTAFPAAQAYDDDDTINETAATRHEVQVYLKRYANQFALENFQLGTMTAAEANALSDAARGLSYKLRGDVINGVSTSVAIGTGSGTKGVDAVIPGPRTPAGVGSLKFNDTGDLLQYKAPGDSAYGTALAVTADLSTAHHYLYSGNPSYWIMITFDISDSAAGGDWEYTDTTDGLTFTTTKTMDGIGTLCDPVNRIYGNLHATVPTANGDAASIAQLDWILRNLKGPSSEYAIFAPHRTCDSYRQLLGGAGGMTPAMWQGMELGPAVVTYRGVPIIPEDQILLTETVGTTTDATSVFGVRFNTETGLCGYFGNPGGPTTALQDDTTGQPIPSPVWIRQLGEKEEKDQQMTRMTGFFACALKQNQALVEVHGITN